MSYRDIVKAQLKVDEGLKYKPYRDTVGKLTIGVGRNLEDVGVSLEEVELMLENDIHAADRTARALFVTFDKLSEARKAVLVNMAFNLGQTRLAQFKKLREAVHNEDWGEAAKQMLTSLWASQVGARAVRLAKQMEAG